ncbi:histidinol-phosphate transaminase [Arenimonas sp.]|uniref:histidinol-phosphate transaminase n=1 Tax=Arenimonas sp. TaxID=1872635 RepID=UPI0039E52F9F
MNPNLNLARPEILTLQPYVYAAWDHRYERMHANENPWRAAGDDSTLGLNVYPESPAEALHARLAELYGVNIRQVLAGRGSDEGIDLLIRSFCRAGQDSIITCPPTFGFYRVAAEVQGAGVIEVPLIRSNEGFALDADKVLAACHNNTNVKLVFLCSPGNPPGNALDRAQMLSLCTQLNGRALVVVDEAYVEFTGRPSFTQVLADHPNLVILRTLSKAYALAGSRCGTTIADAEIISVLARVIPPYAIPTSTVESVLAATAPEQRTRIAQQIELLISERSRLSQELQHCSLIRHVFPSDANFILVECVDADVVFNAAKSVGLVVRDQRKQPQCGQCLRITVGTPEQNARLLQGIRNAGKLSA